VTPCSFELIIHSSQLTGDQETGVVDAGATLPQPVSGIKRLPGFTIKGII